MRVVLVMAVLVSLMGAQAASQKAATQKTSPAKPSTKSGATVPSSPARAAPDPDEGSIEDGVYTSDFFRFTYTLPEAFNVDEELQAGEEDQSDTSFVLLAAAGPLNGEDRRDVVVIIADREATTPEAYVQKVTRDYAQKQGFEVLKSAYAVTIGGHPFYRADFRKEGTYQSAAFTVLKGYAVGFSMAAPNQEAMSAVLDSLSSVKFLGEKPPAKAPAAANKPE
jgi:hypothetical protein